MKNFFIVILTLLVLSLGGFVFYDKVMVKNEKEVNTEEKTEEVVEHPKVYNYSDIEGSYVTTKTATNENMGNNYEVNFNLTLWEDGTFTYKYLTQTHHGIMGNYIIVDNKIMLNYMFEQGNDHGLRPITGSKTLIINEDGTITDNLDTNNKNGDFHGKIDGALTLQKNTTYINQGEENSFDYNLENIPSYPAPTS